VARSNRKTASTVIKERLKSCRRDMSKRRIRAYLVTQTSDLFYLCGFTGEDSAGLVTPNAFHLISDARFSETIRKECPWTTVWMRKGLLDAEIASVCRKLKIRSLAVQGDAMTLASRDAIVKQNRSVRLVQAPPIVATMRTIKGKSEVSTIRRAIRIAEEAFLAMRATIRSGQTELELAARLEYEMKRRGASEPSFTTICAIGAGAALPHAHPGRRKVKHGSAILFDWGARVGRYCSDLTRMVFIGRVAPKIARIYEIVLDAQLRAIRAVCPGQRMCDVDAVARDFIKEAGYAEQFGHGLGHGLGLDVHEPPSLSWRSDERLKAGMLVTVEPGIYLPGVGGVRIEDDVLVTPNGRRVLSRLSKTLEDAIIR